MKKIFGICFFVLMTGCILTHSSLSLAYAALGLNLWYEKMVPVLLPFMILSGTLIRMGMTDSLIRPVRPLFGRIFRLPGPGIYVILVGFLCGFPMGARTIADLRNRQELSSEEGQYLLAFCNNLGPVYFLGFVLPLLHRKLVLPYVFGMYGIPLLYGISLRYSVYINRIPEKTDQAFGRDNAAKLLEQTDPACLPAISLPDALDDAITAAGSTNHADAFAKATQLFDPLSANAKVIVLFTSRQFPVCTAFGDQWGPEAAGRQIPFVYVIAFALWRFKLYRPDRKLYPQYRAFSQVLHPS